MIINHNLGAMNALRNMNVNSANANKSMQKLSSGLRINSASDDAAGLAISEKMRGQIRGLDQAAANSQDGISLIQTAEGGLNETTSMLQRMRELVVQANNGTNSSDDKAQIQKEVSQLSTEITELGNRTEFNTQKLLTGTLGVRVNTGASTSTAYAGLTAAGVTIDVSGADSGKTFTITAATNGAGQDTITLSDGSTSQSIDVANVASYTGTLSFDKLGVNLSSTGTVNYAAGSITGDTIVTAGTSTVLQIGANANQSLSISFSDMRSEALGTTAGSLDVAHVDVTSTTQSFNTRLQIVDDAIKQVSSERAKMGAYQNRLEHTINSLGTTSENLTSAESRIRDVDMAKEMSTFSKNNILSQAAQAMLAQANQAPQQVLQLLR